MLADELVRMIAEQSGEVLDFSPESLRTLDALLAERAALAEPYRGDGAEANHPLVLPLAAYAGEVMIRHLGSADLPAGWVTEPAPDRMRPPHVLIGDNLRVNILKKAHQFASGIEPPAFWLYYWTVAELLDTSESDPA